MLNQEQKQRRSQEQFRPYIRQVNIFILIFKKRSKNPAGIARNIRIISSKFPYQSSFPTPGALSSLSILILASLSLFRRRQL